MNSKSTPYIGDTVVLITGKYKGKLGVVRTVSKKRYTCDVYIRKASVTARIFWKHFDIVTPEEYPELFI